ncbi:hypothetical protein LV780_07405 [Cereibacter azotoformans]|uniref:Uncharacterized protein n=1 Tax=Cereibacter azotoformans TaxID=43057 RepID=A0A2T5KDD6_9RHOB|nr:hypothetical protein [Cereibacter azotoformans]PTR20435.1 hypothetical protein C8J28_102200 [Cereibacter azotoformans]UIJ31993.1 hypothetical protein LV780_07405 [Cereibacter azotoformans]
MRSTIDGHTPSVARAVRGLGAAVANLRRALPAADRPRLLDGLRVGLLGDAASPGLTAILRYMGAHPETVALDGRRLAADRRPDAVVVSWPSAAGCESAEWRQVARMKLDNPRLVVILLDWSRGRIAAPLHDLRIGRGASTAEVRATLAELRRLRREQAIALAARSHADAPAEPLFRRPQRPSAAPRYPLAETVLARAA